MFSNLNQKLSHFAALGLVLGTLVIPGLASATTSQPRDSDSNSIIWGGAYSKTEWLNDLAKGDGHHTASNLQQIYYKEGRGITQANFSSKSTVDGTVFKDGHVEVAGKTVATGAQSVGRNFMTGSHKSGSVWERATSVSFNSNSIPAFVDMEGDTFHYAIIKSCGNPVRATPVAKSTPKPTVTPKPTPTSTPKPTPTPVAEQKFQCVSLTPSQPDKNKPGLFRFTVAKTIKNVTLTGYRFTVNQKSSNGDTTVSTDVKDNDATKDFADFTFGAGIWEVQAQVKTSAGITAISDECSSTVIVTQEKPSPSPTPTPTPATPQVLGATLPATGPEAALGGIAGVTALGYAGRAYLRSRKSVIDALRGKNRR
jgi:hypothetical protein